MCVVTGPACNDTIEQTVSLEQRLLSCITDRGGVPCADPDGSGSRAGRVGNVVVAFVRAEESSCVVDASCKAAAEAAFNEACKCQTASDIYTSAAQKSRAECKMLDAAKWQAEADKLTREAQAARSRNRILTFAAHNSSFGNSWRIDLHGQSEATAVSKVLQLLCAFRAMGHPGGITLRVITGKGLHSVNHIAKVRPAVLKFLSDEVPREFHCNDGRLFTVNYQGHDGASDGVVLVSMLPKGDEGSAGGSAAAAGRLV
jgi:DNA-nicking Smr family endonuclease